MTDQKGMTITYKAKNGIYVNMTNRCPCACTFCLRQNAPGVYGSDPLWLEREPTVEEVEQSLSKWDLNSMDEVVFCGYGEPAERLKDLLEVAAWLKKNYTVKTRINTNGLADLIWGETTAKGRSTRSPSASTPSMRRNISGSRVRSSASARMTRCSSTRTSAQNTCRPS